MIILSCIRAVHTLRLRLGFFIATNGLCRIQCNCSHVHMMWLQQQLPNPSHVITGSCDKQITVAIASVWTALYYFDIYMTRFVILRISWVSLKLNNRLKSSKVRQRWILCPQSAQTDHFGFTPLHRTLTLLSRSLSERKWNALLLHWHHKRVSVPPTFDILILIYTWVNYISGEKYSKTGTKLGNDEENVLL